MNRIKKNPVGFPGFSKNVQVLNKADNNTKAIVNHSASVQRQRVLQFLKEKGSATTIDFRTGVDVLHPAARIMELRKRGYRIVMTWDYAENPGGTTHRIGRYTLMPGKHQEAV